MYLIYWGDNCHMVADNSDVKEIMLETLNGMGVRASWKLI
jgi:hypothetical protein